MMQSCYCADFMAQGQITGTSGALAAKDSTGEGRKTLSHPDSFEQSLHLPAEITESFCQMMFEIGPVKCMEGLETTIIKTIYI